MFKLLKLIKKDIKNELKKYGSVFERHELFPSRVNTEFIEVKIRLK